MKYRDDRQTDGWMDGWIDGRMDGQIDKYQDDGLLPYRCDLLFLVGISTLEVLHLNTENLIFAQHIRQDVSVVPAQD